MILLNEFGAELRYVKGVDNTVADAISRLDYCPKINPHSDDEVDEKGDWKKSISHHEKWSHMMTLMSHYHNPDENSEAAEQPSKNVMAHLFANTETQDDAVYPVTISEIAEAQ
eukprot:scaffold31704_cov150-Skeletonema_dohrnii-CCMP3373.AAC.1